MTFNPNSTVYQPKFSESLAMSEMSETDLGYQHPDFVRTIRAIHATQTAHMAQVISLSSHRVLDCTLDGHDEMDTPMGIESGRQFYNLAERAANENSEQWDKKAEDSDTGLKSLDELLDRFEGWAEELMSGKRNKVKPWMERRRA